MRGLESQPLFFSFGHSSDTSRKIAVTDTPEFLCDVRLEQDLISAFGFPPLDRPPRTASGTAHWVSLLGLRTHSAASVSGSPDCLPGPGARFLLCCGTSRQGSMKSIICEASRLM